MEYDVAKRRRHGGRAGRALRGLRRYPLIGRLAKVAGFACLLALTGLAMLTVIGCPPPVEPSNNKPYVGRSSKELVPHFEQVPTIRVLVGSGPALHLSTSGGYRTLADNKLLAEATRPMPEVELVRTAEGWDLGGNQYAGGRLIIECVDRSSVRLGQTDYRGKLVFTPGEGNTIVAINHLDLESYLAGVIGKELYSKWNDVTYQAQCVAARTYALYEKATIGEDRDYDVRNDQGSQVYGGLSGETDKSWRAVQATHGQVLAYGPLGKERIFKAYFSACCGGMSNSASVLNGDPVFPPLAGGRVCEDCSACTKYRWAAVTIPRPAVYKALVGSYPAASGLGSLASIEVAEYIHSNRPLWVDCVGGNGQRLRIRADDLRLALLRSGNAQAKLLYSMNCSIKTAGDNIVFSDGRGFGHGVGLCQWGAEAKADAGYTAEQILLYYYPGAKIIKAYQ